MLLPKPSAGNITVTNLIRFSITNMIIMSKVMIDVLNKLNMLVRFTSLNLLFSMSVLITFFFNFFFTSSALNIRNMLGIQQNAMLVCLLLTNKEVS